jgi:CheY-like chemotaxis protein
MSASTVLVVDDDEASLEALSMLLEQMGLHTITARSGEAALDVVKHARVDLILLDLRMPGLSGFDVLSRLQGRSRRRVPVVMTTASGDSHDVGEALRLGAVGYILKPVRAEVLRTRIQRHLRLPGADLTAGYVTRDDVRRFSGKVKEGRVTAPPRFHQL